MTVLDISLSRLFQRAGKSHAHCTVSALSAGMPKALGFLPAARPPFLPPLLSHPEHLRRMVFSFGVLTLLMLVCLLPEMALASEQSGGGLPYEDWLTKLRKSVSGPVAFGVSIIGVVVTGAALIFGGELNAFFRSMIFLVLVMALLVTANKIVGSFFGGAEIAAAAAWVQSSLLSASHVTLTPESSALLDVVC